MEGRDKMAAGCFVLGGISGFGLGLSGFAGEGGIDNPLLATASGLALVVNFACILVFLLLEKKKN